MGGRLQLPSLVLVLAPLVLYALVLYALVICFLLRFVLGAIS
jgi:hypothetical protein